MTDDELLRFCAVNDVWQIERDANGEIVVMTPAGFGSSNMNVKISRLLDEWAERDGRGTTTESSGGYSLRDGSVRAPDAAWISFERLLPLNDKQKTGFAPVCPEFVIELKSPSDRLSQLRAKMEMWIANGAEVAWLIDPQRKVVEIYRPGDSPEVLHEPSSVHGTGPVAGFELVMARVWA
jgi:Uma2 family endonuclease